ncbi:MAG: 4-hydroxythreonine-4-phosphate dehydrogenase PdxA [Phycisphaerales bacterium]|nr:MAG: 4-hydroxythreonine-4-phosphate dehydrogenase PdxA [Phycisphaerales bacterium]
MVTAKPILTITMGDPSGIGPEIAAKALAEKPTYKICHPLIVGDANAMRQAVDIAGVDLKIRPVSEVVEAEFQYGIMDVIDLKNVDVNCLEHGKVSASAGKAAFEAIKKAIELALVKQIDGTVTGPIHKGALNLAGHHFSGHTEIYAHYTNTQDYAMMLAEESFRIVHVTTHVSLRQACDLVKKERVLKVIQLADDVCKKLGIANPRVGVAGLNPHSSDGGLFGCEEEKEIIPALEAARTSGINADGPVPPDILFSKTKGGRYDVAIAMYHDQGHIPLKLCGFTWDEDKNKWHSVSGVNVTLGLPIIRTSVDHGTAFDIAGKGTATAKSLINAIEYAAKMAGAK